MRRKLLALLCISAMTAGLLGGCGNGETQENAADAGNAAAQGQQEAADNGAADSDNTLYIHYMTCRNETQAEILAMQDIAKSYQEEHPELDFTFEVESIPDRTSYLQKLKILGASDELPEWFESDPDTWVASIAEQGKIYDINSLYDELGMQDKIFDISKEYAKLNDGSLWLMTFQCNTEYFFYHKNMFEDAGITKEPATFDEFIDVCDKLKAKGYTPLAVGSDWPPLRYFAMIPFRMTGNEYIQNAVSGKASFGEEAGLKAAEFMQKMGEYYQVGWTTSDSNTMNDLFTSGQTAMIYNGTWALADLTDENKELLDDIDYFTMPTYSDTDVTAATDFFANSGIGTAVRADAMTDQMKDFIGYLLNHYAEAALNHNILPSVMPDEETIAGLPEVYQQVIRDVEGVEQYAKCWDVVIDSASVEPLEKETTSLILGEITPEEWAANMDEIVKENLANLKSD